VQLTNGDVALGSLLAGPPEVSVWAGSFSQTETNLARKPIWEGSRPETEPIGVLACR
jgi:hypothetical protein